MDLTRDIDSYKRRLNKIVPVKNPPKLKMNIFQIFPIFSISKGTSWYI